MARSFGSFAGFGSGIETNGMTPFLHSTILDIVRSFEFKMHCANFSKWDQKLSGSFDTLDCIKFHIYFD